MFGMWGQVGPFTVPEVMAYAQKTFSDEFYLDANANVTNMVRKDVNAKLKLGATMINQYMECGPGC